MTQDTGFARCCVAMWLYDHPDGVAIEEIECLLEAVPDKIILQAREDDHAMMLFLRTFVDNGILVGRIAQGDIASPMAATGTVQ